MSNEPKPELEYTLSIFLHPQDTGDRFVTWPLHITLMPWFRFNAPMEETVHDLQGLASRYQPFTVVGGEKALFGSERNIEVTLVQRDENLQRLHNDVLALLKGNGWLAETPAFSGPDYRPHVTKKEGRVLHDGEVVRVHDFYMVSAPIGDHRTRTKTVKAAVALGEHGETKA